MPRRPIGPAALKATLSPRFTVAEADALRAAAAAAGAPVCTWLRTLALRELALSPVLAHERAAAASRSDAA
jgi:hypothetical protein